MTQTAADIAVDPSHIDEGRRYREQGGYRKELVHYLRQCGADEAGAEHLADRFDLELGLAGRPHPEDINPAIARQLDAHRQLMSLTSDAPASIAAVEAAVDPGTPAPAVASAEPVATHAPTQEAASHGAQFPPPAVVPTLAETQADLEAAAPPARPAAAVQAVSSPPAPTSAAPAPAAPAPTPAPAAADSPESAPASTQPGPEQPAEQVASSDGPAADADWQETTEFGYRIAASWDEHDPNVAINEATDMARSGKSLDEIVTYLVSCNVSPDEAQYVAAMTGARRVAPKGEGGRAKRKKSRAPTIVLSLAMLAALLVVAYLGYTAWKSGTPWW